LLTTLFWTSLSALGLGLLILSCVHFLPRQAPTFTVILAIISLLVLLGMTFVTKYKIELFRIFSDGFKYIVVFIIVLLVIIIAVMGLMYRKALYLQGIFLDYTKRFLYDVPGAYCYILLFLLVSLCLISLFIFQHIAFSSRQHQNTNFFDYTNPGLLGFLNII